MFGFIYLIINICLLNSRRARPLSYFPKIIIWSFVSALITALGIVAVILFFTAVETTRVIEYTTIRQVECNGAYLCSNTSCTGRVCWTSKCYGAAVVMDNDCLSNCIY